MAVAIIMFTGLSSTIRMRVPRSASGAGGAAPAGSVAAAVSGSGSSAQKRLPSPGRLSTPTCPPISRASSRQIDRPSPVPP